MSALIALAWVALLAYVNGANDNFKGVATLFGSGVSNYRKALGWATAAKHRRREQVTPARRGRRKPEAAMNRHPRATPR